MLFFIALLSSVYCWSYTLHCYTPTATQYSHSHSRTHQLVPSVRDFPLRLTDSYYDVLPNRTDCRWRRSSAEREDGGSRVGQVHLHCRREQAIQGGENYPIFLISFILYYSVLFNSILFIFLVIFADELSLDTHGWESNCCTSYHYSYLIYFGTLRWFSAY